MKKLVDAIKICYRHNWGELDSDYLEIVYDICREEGVNLAGCQSSNELIKRIFSFLKSKYKHEQIKDNFIDENNKVFDLSDYRKRRYENVYDKLMDKTNIDLVLYNILARELLKFRYNRLKDAPITQLIDEDEACSEEVLFIGIIGSLCKQYFSYGINDGIKNYPSGALLKENLADVIRED